MRHVLVAAGLLWVGVLVGAAAAHAALPAFVEIPSSPFGNAGSPIRCTLGTLRSGAHATVTIVAVARTAGRQVNSVAATSTSWDLDPKASVAVAATIVTAAVPLSPPSFTG